MKSTQIDPSSEAFADLLDARGFMTSAGGIITPETAIRQATVYACVRILSESIAQLPVHLYRKDGNLRERVESSDSMRLVAMPNEFQTRHEFWQLQVAWVELQGNGYAYKTRTGGKIRELLPIPPQAVRPELHRGRIIYHVTAHESQVVRDGTYEAADIMHLRNVSHSLLCGISTISAHRENYALANRLQEHAAVLFKNGAQLGRVLQFPTGTWLSDDNRESLKNQLQKNYTGAQNAHKTLVLEGGAELKSVAMTNEDAQFLESQKYEAGRIASIFGVPSFLLNDTEKNTTWGSGLEQITRGFLQFALMPRLKRIEQRLNRELLPQRQNTTHEFRYDTDAFAVGPLKERMEAYEKAIQNGIWNADEVRAREGDNPRPGGDKYRIPMNIQVEGQEDAEQD